MRAGALQQRLLRLLAARIASQLLARRPLASTRLPIRQAAAACAATAAAAAVPLAAQCYTGSALEADARGQYKDRFDDIWQLAISSEAWWSRKLRWLSEFTAGKLTTPVEVREQHGHDSCEQAYVLLKHYLWAQGRRHEHDDGPD